MSRVREVVQGANWVSCSAHIDNKEYADRWGQQSDKAVSCFCFQADGGKRPGHIA